MMMVLDLDVLVLRPPALPVICRRDSLCPNRSVYKELFLSIPGVLRRKEEYWRMHLSAWTRQRIHHDIMWEFHKRSFGLMLMDLG